ncbi:2-oxoadipate dioxygenase/decarboxylase family protein [Sphingomonas sp. ID0503]|uniref:2-oxoadipate dioxygenase/decarboxylase family protein n=1 Tax=Sphingomonas sp. ID0503 TaxID=3399691 RepID=UPI003AFA6A1C
MSSRAEGSVARLVASAIGEEAAARSLSALRIAPALLSENGARVSRAAFAMALNVVLFDDLLDRVPSGAAYVREVAAENGVFFDHGALRTIRFADGPTGALPAGETAFKRLLEPIGYSLAGLYPLPKLKMQGHVYAHADLPAEIPQFFVSELYVDQFDGAFEAAAHRVFDSSRDPIDAATVATLDSFAAEGSVDFTKAAAALPVLAGAFGRHHDVPALTDYEVLKAQSAEAAWIATEGNAFNHATDRVQDVEALAQMLKDQGRPMKDTVEISGSGRVKQTAFRADQVEREFRDADGRMVTRAVPGSFYEFITRLDDEAGRIDLKFDAGNATGIFAMTKAG